jgi:hypothetical protein
MRKSLPEQSLLMIAKVATSDTAHRMFRRDDPQMVSCHQTNIDLSLERHRVIS